MALEISFAEEMSGRSGYSACAEWAWQHESLLLCAYC